jgi:hypothetical protein
MHKQLQAIATVLPLINLAIFAAIFERAVAGESLTVFSRKEGI